MSLLEPRILAPFLAEIGITPQGTPAAFDVAQREVAGWFAAGGTMRAYLERNRHRQDWGMVSVRAARRELEHRYLPAWMAAP